MIGVAPDEARAEIQRRALRAKARERLIPYCCFVDPAQAENYKAKHLRVAAAHLEAVERGEIKRLMMTFPPRGWKTSLGSRKMGEWFIGKRFMAGLPYAVMVASYGASLAQDEISAPVRDTVRDNPLYREVFPEVEIAKSATSSELWKLRTRDGRSDEPYAAMAAATRKCFAL